MNKEQLQSEMIRIYGFESPETIQFFQLCENQQIDEKVLNTIVEIHRKRLQDLMDENY